jgi:hypothetical protein
VKYGGKYKRRGRAAIAKAGMKSTLRILPGLICLFLAMLGSPAWADGIVFAKAVPTTTPDQRAMLQFSNGVERLASVREVSYLMNGGEHQFAATRVDLDSPRLGSPCLR